MALVDLGELGFEICGSFHGHKLRRETTGLEDKKKKLKVQFYSSHVFNLIFKKSTFQQIIGFEFVYPFYRYIQYMMSMIDNFYFFLLELQSFSYITCF